MGVSKVIYNGKNLIDLTGDTVSPETLAKGITAHDMAGNKITGTLTAKSDLIDVSKLPTTVDDSKIYRVKGERTAKGYISNSDGIYEISLVLTIFFGATISVNYIVVDELPTTGIAPTDTVWTAYILTTTNVGYFYFPPEADVMDTEWVDFATFATEATGEAYINKGAVGSPSEITEKGLYIVYTNKTIIGIPNKNGDKKSTFWNGSSWGAGTSKVVELDGENLPDVGEEGTIYFRYNVPCLMIKTKSNEGVDIDIPYFEYALLISGSRFFEYNIISNSAPTIPITLGPLALSVYHTPSKIYYALGDEVYEMDIPIFNETVYIRKINEVWYYREGKYVKISKTGWTDSELENAEYEIGVSYVGDTYSIKTPFSQRQAITYGVSGELASSRFALDGMWNDFRSVRVGALAGCTGVTKIDAFSVNDTSYGGNNSIGAAAFYGCTGLTKLNIEAEGGIGAHAFYGCTNLRSVYVYGGDDGLPNIGEYAFANCVNLDVIHFNGTKEQWDSGTFGRGWNENMSVNRGGYSLNCTDKGYYIKV